MGQGLPFNSDALPGVAAQQRSLYTGPEYMGESASPQKGFRARSVPLLPSIERSTGLFGSRFASSPANVVETSSFGPIGLFPHDWHVKNR